MRSTATSIEESNNWRTEGGEEDRALQLTWGGSLSHSISFLRKGRTGCEQASICSSLRISMCFLDTPRTEEEQKKKEST